MNKEIISDRQGISMIILFIGGSTFALGTAAQAKQDVWLSVIISLAFALPTILIYSKLLTLFPEKNLFGIIQSIFGNIFGKIISLLYVWYFFHLGSLVLINFAEFTNTVGLKFTPKVVIKCSFMLLIVWVVKEGIEVLGRWVALFVLVLIGIEFIAITLKIPIMNVDNLRPFLSNGIKSVMSGAFSTFTFPFAETIIFMTLFNSLKNNRSRVLVYILGLSLGGIAVFAAAVSEMLVLGENLYSVNYFPTYATVSLIKIGGFLERGEIVVSIALLIGGFTKISVCLLACCKGISDLMNFSDYRFIVTPIGILFILMATIVHDSTMDMAEWAFGTYNYYAFLFQVILPIIILIGAIVKKKKKIFNF